MVDGLVDEVAPRAITTKAFPFKRSADFRLVGVIVVFTALQLPQSMSKLAFFPIGAETLLHEVPTQGSFVLPVAITPQVLQLAMHPFKAV